MDVSPKHIRPRLEHDQGRGEFSMDGSSVRIRFHIETHLRFDYILSQFHLFALEFRIWDMEYNLWGARFRRRWRWSPESAAFEFRPVIQYPDNHRASALRPIILDNDA